MEVRIAEAGDSERIAELMQINGYDREGAIRRASSINSNKKLILVFEENFDLLGYAGIKKQAEEYPINFDVFSYAEILWVGVHPDFRHKGFGSRLVRACDDIALEWEKQGICLNCRKKVIPFYKINGYRVVGSYPHKGPRVVMAKDLK